MTLQVIKLPFALIYRFVRNRFLRRICESFQIYRISVLQKRAIKKLRDKEVLRCVFFCLFDEVWKFDDVYKKMECHPRFDPIILVCPIVSYDKDYMIYRLNKCYNFFKMNGYRVINSYDIADNKYIDVVNDINPDIIFFTNPYRGLIDDRYYIYNFPQILTCYTNYCFFENNDMSLYDSLFSNFLWRYYCETPIHAEYCKMFSRSKGRNAVLTGYPGIEKLIVKNPVLDYRDWKTGNDHKCKIIWAPHHTMEAVGNVFYSCFLQYCEVMINLAEKYKDQIQIVFKPHPLLKVKLFEKWGKRETEDYYNKWETMQNTSINEGSYYDLFLTSDAIIHDSASFIAEYLYINKPALRLMNGVPAEQMYNDFTMECLKYYYKAFCEQDIEKFIMDVIRGHDPLKEARTKFVREVLLPKGSPSDNIINDILGSIDNQILYHS